MPDERAEKADWQCETGEAAGAHRRRRFGRTTIGELEGQSGAGRSATGDPRRKEAGGETDSDAKDPGGRFCVEIETIHLRGAAPDRGQAEQGKARVEDAAEGSRE